jgi:GrpB protein
VPEVNGPRLISDEDLQHVRLDKVTPHNAPITLAGYDPGWPVLFAREAARIRAALGGRAVQVEHVGSTSVPGLAAKPIVDILLPVPHSSDEQAYVPALEAAGYVLRACEPDWFEHRMFKGPGADINLHVFTAGAAEIDGCCCSGTGSAPTTPTGTPTCRSNATWPGGPGGTCSTLGERRAGQVGLAGEPFDGPGVGGVGVDGRDGVADDRVHGTGQPARSGVGADRPCSQHLDEQQVEDP